MVKPIEELEKNPMESKEIRKWAEEIMNFAFTTSQDYLVKNQSIEVEKLQNGMVTKYFLNTMLRMLCLLNMAK